MIDFENSELWKLRPVKDLDSELDLWFSGLGRVRFEFISNANVTRICQCISEHVL